MEENNNNNKSDFTNYDSVINRKNELAYQDKTLYDEKVANIVSDYYNLTKELIDLAERKGATSEELDKIRNIETKSTHRDGTKRTFKNLLDDRFNISKIIRIQRSVDSDDVANKWCDFLSATISRLYTQGVDDVLKTRRKCSHEGKNPISELSVFIDELKAQKDNISQDHYLQLINASDNLKFNLQKSKLK